MPWSTYHQYESRYDAYEATRDYGCAASVAKRVMLGRTRAMNFSRSEDNNRLLAFYESIRRLVRLGKQYGCSFLPLVAMLAMG
jgi:hypothetical protein